MRDNHVHITLANRVLISHTVILIDHTRQGSIVGSVVSLHGPDRQRSHASAGQPDRPEGEDQLGRQRVILGRAAGDVPEDPADEPDVLY
jgi:hypothetical protein